MNLKQKYEKITYEQLEKVIGDMFATPTPGPKIKVYSGAGYEKEFDKAMKAEVKSMQDKQHQADLEEARRIINED